MTSVEEARAAVRTAEETLTRWQADSVAKAAELTALEQRAGDDVLADESAASHLVDTMTRLRAGIDIADRAAAAAERKLVDERRGLLRAEAGELRDRAARLRADAAGRQERTAVLLRQLAEHEGVEFGPARQYRPDGTDTAGWEPRTRTQQMLADADAHEARANALDGAAGGAAEDVTRVAQQVAAGV